MNKFPKWYNYEKRECQICGWLLQPTLLMMKVHVKEPYHLLKQMDKDMERKVNNE